MNKQKKPLYFYYLLILVIIVAGNLIFSAMEQNRIKDVSYNTFIRQTVEKHIDKVEIGDQSISYTLKKDDKTIYQTETMETDTALSQRLYDAGATFTRVHTKEMNPWLSFLITGILPIVLLFWLGNHMFKRMQKKMGGDAMSFGGGGGLGSFGKSDAKIYVKSQTGKTFLDVAGQEEAKAALQEMVEFLKSPERYKKIGAQMPKGALLVGPPGTGKTLLAKAVAGEANVPFFSISGSEFVEMFVGRGAARVRDLFKQAREKAPCIVFIDEIDTIGKKRDGAGVGGNDEREQTLNQLLAEMDGFDGSTGVIILAATNRPESLDQALLRPGRFDRRIPVDLPDLAGREAILLVHAKDVKMGKNIDFRAIARATAGASGAELANIINEAALLAVKDNRNQVIQKDLEDSVETVIAGYERKNAVISTKEKLIVSYHEIGHALVAAKAKNSMPVTKITIVPRTSGARAAEDLIFHSITSGASNDIEQATRIARSMITRLGMSETFGMIALETVNNKYLGGDTSLACSDQTAARVDEEVRRLIQQAYDEARRILEENKDKLHELAKFLYERETITGDQFMEIVNRVPQLETAQEL